MKRIAICIVSLVLAVLMSINTVAAVGPESDNYIISDGNKIPISTAYTCSETIYDFNGRLNSAQDLFIDDNGRLFIADTSNNRIICCDEKGKVFFEITEGNGKKLAAPEGVFVDEKCSIFVSDTGNGRIVHYNPEGKYIEEFCRPESDYLGETYVFNPTKMIVNTTGYIYTLKSQTIMTIDAKNRFRGYLGQSDVGFNLIESLARIFASEEQLKQLKKRESESYLNITLGKDGLIYAVSREVGSEIKVLNSVGENLYRSSTAASTTLFTKIKTTFFSLFNIGNYASKSFSFGETVIEDGVQKNPLFVDIAVDEYGIITALDATNCRLYQYDAEGNLLCVFAEKGRNSGQLELPTSCAVAPNGNIYVIDAMMNCISVFTPTDFIDSVHLAVSLYNSGNYEAAYDLWKDISATSENYELADIGMGKVLYKQKDYKAAMEHYEDAGERGLYSTAYAKYRHQVFRKNFGFLILGIIAAVVLFVLALMFLSSNGKKGYKKFGPQHRENKKSLLAMTQMSFNMLFHPIDTVNCVRANRETLNYIYCGIMVVLIMLARIGALYLTSYPLMTAELADINLGLEFLKLGLPVLTWGLSVFFVTSILDGESKIGEIYTCCLYSMVPFVILTPLFTALSHILCQAEGGIFNFLQAFMWVWILILLFVSVYYLNNYTFGKTVGVCLLSIVVMALIWAIAFLFIAIIGEVWSFISSIVIEVSIMLL